MGRERHCHVIALVLLVSVSQQRPVECLQKQRMGQAHPKITSIDFDDTWVPGTFLSARMGDIAPVYRTVRYSFLCNVDNRVEDLERWHIPHSSCLQLVNSKCYIGSRAL